MMGSDIVFRPWHGKVKLEVNRVENPQQNNSGVFCLVRPHTCCDKIEY